MSGNDRKNYIRAVKCLATKPSRSNHRIVPGARSRFDDFIGSHIQQGYNIHFSGKLFAWHRAFLWEYEQALRNECGYRGAHPYWDWPKYHQDPASSPLFDGSDTSLGSNGEYFPHGATVLTAFGLTLTLPGGTGGGPVYKGPFANFTVKHSSAPPRQESLLIHVLQINLGLTPPDPLPAQSLDLVVPSNGTVPMNGTTVPVVAKSALGKTTPPPSKPYNPPPPLFTTDVPLSCIPLWHCLTKPQTTTPDP